MADLELNNDIIRLTTRGWKTEFETFKHEILSQQEMYHDSFKHNLYGEINNKIDEINQLFRQIHEQRRDDINNVKNEIRSEVFNIEFELSKQELYTKRKEKEYKRRIWLQGRKRRK